MTEQTVWQPVEDGQWEQDGCDLDVDAGGTQLHMYHDTGLDLVTILPDDVRLCRRVPAPQGSVPDHVRSVLHAALILYITECREVDDADGEMYARQAQQWLDSQRPAPGQEVNE